MRRKTRLVPEHILVFNSGSSSLKFSLFRHDNSDVNGEPLLGLLASGEIEAIGGSGPARFQASSGHGEQLVYELLEAATPLSASLLITRLLGKSGLPAPDAIGHRVVHGGPSLQRHCRIDDAVLQTITAAGALTPLHAAAALAVIGQQREAHPDCPQFACFDTAFHTSLPERVRRLPLSLALHEAGIRRYGFHGLSCESILRQLGSPLPERIIVAHLGSGSSVTAIHSGRSFDTSMGLTPGGGLPMATRSGDLDPGVLLQLMRDPLWTTARIEDLVERRSGLLGVSEVSGDMRRLHAVAASNPKARLAIGQYCVAVAKQIAAMISVLDGVDLLVFTGGLGEHDPKARAMICDHLGWIGVKLYPQRNAEATNPLSACGSRVKVIVLPSQEAQQIALHVAALTAA